MGIVDKAKELRDKVAESGKPEDLMAKTREKLDSATGHRFGDTTDKGAQAAKGAAGQRPADTADNAEKPETADKADNPADGE